MTMKAGPLEPVEIVLGIRIYTGPPEPALDAAFNGALVLAPSGPGLADDFIHKPSYREALLTADVNITDSGFMLLLWRLRTGRKLPRFSGLGYLRALLARDDAKEAGALFWVMPSEAERDRNVAWLQAQGFATTAADCYVAPHYGKGPLKDEALLAILRERRPRVVMLAIGGGVQERLGLGLREALATGQNPPGIVCIGAAIAFLTGGQVAIPEWADRLVLGWLFRIVSSPRAYVPRFVRALKLVGLIARYRHRLPPLKDAA